jgi:hypothetical protein
MKGCFSTAPTLKKKVKGHEKLSLSTAPDHGHLERNFLLEEVAPKADFIEPHSISDILKKT